MMVGLRCRKYCCIDLFVNVDNVRDVFVFIRLLCFLGKCLIISGGLLADGLRGEVVVSVRLRGDSCACTMPKRVLS